MPGLQGVLNAITDEFRQLLRVLRGVVTGGLRPQHSLPLDIRICNHSQAPIPNRRSTSKSPLYYESVVSSVRLGENTTKNGDPT